MTHTVHEVDIPAINGLSPLGFLAALGMLHVLSAAEAGQFELSFSDVSGTAVIHSPLASLDDIEATLKNVVAAAAEDAPIAGVDVRFPLQPGQHADPMRCVRESYRELAREITRIDSRAAEDWLPHLLTDLAVDQKGRADLTPFSAPSGKQSLRTFFEKPMTEVRSNPGRILEALAGWRRMEGFSGEYFDHHVLNSAADDPLGRSVESGVPGATWLATMAMPLLRVTGDGHNVAATLWHHAGRRFLMIWPLWHQPLDARAVQVLIEHPCLKPTDAKPTLRRRDWPVLGIFGVCGAERQRIPGRKFAGVLAPISISAVG